MTKTDTRVEIEDQPDIHLRLVTTQGAAEIKQLYIDNVDFIARYNYGWTDTSLTAISKKVDQVMQAIAEGKTVEYLIVQKNNTQEEVIGAVSFYDINSDQNEAFISYTLAEQYTGHGHAKAAAQRLTDYGVKQFGFKKVLLEIDPDNLPSRKIAESLGAHPVGEVYVVKEAGKQFPNQKWEIKL